MDENEESRSRIKKFYEVRERELAQEVRSNAAQPVKGNATLVERLRRISEKMRCIRESEEK
jgi:polyphosphate kinase